MLSLGADKRNVIMKSLRALARYILVCLQWAWAHPRYIQPFAWMKDYSRWRQDRNSTAQPLDRMEPWICYSAIRHLKQITRQDMRVFEYGSGGSTLYFAKHCQEVVAVDHDTLWAQRVNEALAEHQMSHAKALPVPDETPAEPADADPQQGYGSSYAGFVGRSFKTYVNTLRQYPRHHFNVIVVDGRSRPACIKLASEYLAPGGVIIVDNADRERYDPMQNACFNDNWHLTRCAGPGQAFRTFSATNFWIHQPKA
jgi:hypothetical protein